MIINLLMSKSLFQIKDLFRIWSVWFKKCLIFTRSEPWLKLRLLFYFTTKRTNSLIYNIHKLLTTECCIKVFINNDPGTKVSWPDKTWTVNIITAWSAGYLIYVPCNSSLCGCLSQRRPWHLETVSPRISSDRVLCLPNKGHLATCIPLYNKVFYYKLILTNTGYL